MLKIECIVNRGFINLLMVLKMHKTTVNDHMMTSSNVKTFPRYWPPEQTIE